MATFYLDLENGDDANDGLSFANRWLTFSNGATAARIAPGDTIRVMGSPAPTSLGINATWTNGKQETEFGSYTSTNTTPVVVTYTGHGYSTGDIVMIRSDTGNNINGTWSITVLDANTFELDGSVGTGTSGGGSRRLVRRTAQAVKLASSLTQSIACTGYETTAAWTPSANVTSVLDETNVKEHKASTSISIAAGFTTGKAAYYTLPSTLDLSGYQQVSFWLYQDTGTLSGTAYTLELCTDTTGDTSVHTIQIPSPLGLDRWIPVTIDLAANMNAAIQSIALYVGTDLGAAILKFDNIIACKASSAADSLTLTSLIGKNISSDTWYGIESINGTRVMLGIYNSIDINDANHPVYAGTSETVTTYKRETIKPAFRTHTIQDSGTAGSLISFEGGWDRTDMSTQNLETWIDGQIGASNGLVMTSKSYISLDKFAWVRWGDALTASGSGAGNEFGELTANNNGGEGFTLSNTSTTVFDSATKLTAIGNVTGVSIGGPNTSVTTVQLAEMNIAYGVHLVGDNVRIDTIEKADGNNSYGVFLDTCDNSEIKTISSASNNNTDGVRFDSSTFGCRVGSVMSNNNRLYGIVFVPEIANCYIFGGGTLGNGTAGIYVGSDVYVKNFSIAEAVEADVISTYDTRNYRLYSTNHDNTANNHRIFTDGGLISSESSVRHTASGIAWKLQPTNDNANTGRNERYPLSLSIAKVAVSANNLVTVKAWMRRDNTNLTMKLVCKAFQLAGIGTSDVTASMSAAADTWEELTITFTPTETGVVEITAEAYGGSTHTGYVDDLTITQA